MKEDTEIQDLARIIRNKKAKEWREKNKDKVKAINHRYWLKKALEFKENQKK